MFAMREEGRAADPASAHRKAPVVPLGSDRRDASLSLSWRPERGWLIVNAAGELSMATRAGLRAYLVWRS
ncbi:hypothetical protein [Streptomyces sp. NPDC002078]